MKNRVQIGRRNMFALAAGLLLLGPSVISPEPLPSLQATTQVTVRPRNGAHTIVEILNPPMAKVRFDLKPLLLSASPTSIEDVETRLNDLYGSAAVLIEQIQEYVYVWLEGEWVRVCLSSASFDVDFGFYGRIAVDVKESVPMY